MNLKFIAITFVTFNLINSINGMEPEEGSLRNFLNVTLQSHPQNNPQTQQNIQALGAYYTATWQQPDYGRQYDRLIENEVINALQQRQWSRAKEILLDARDIQNLKQKLLQRFADENEITNFLSTADN